MGNLTSRFAGKRKHAIPNTVDKRGRVKRLDDGEAVTPLGTTTKSVPVILSAAQIANQPVESFSDPKYGHLTWSTLLSSGITSTDSLTAGIGHLPPETGHLAHHRHEHAEIYLILEGQGIITIDGEETKVEKGCVLFVPGNAEHGIRNCSDKGEKLVWFYCFACDAFGDVKYRFAADEVP